MDQKANVQFQKLFLPSKNQTYLDISNNYNFFNIWKLQSLPQQYLGEEIYSSKLPNG